MSCPEQEDAIKGARRAGDCFLKSKCNGLQGLGDVVTWIRGQGCFDGFRSTGEAHAQITIADYAIELRQAVFGIP